MQTTSRKRRSSAQDGYFELVRKFPLRRLRSDPEHAEAMKVYLRLSSAKKAKGVKEYLDVLVDLIADYERRSRLTIDTSELGAADIILHLLQERNMSVSALAREVGIAQPNLSEMLKGNRDWSKTAIRALSKRFNIRAERFLA